MRTPENVVAVDWQTGKRIWETREDDELEADDTADRLARRTSSDEQCGGQGNPLEQRVWDDALVTSLSSDGERVFVIRAACGHRQDEAMMGWQMAPGIWPAAAEAAADHQSAGRVRHGHAGQAAVGAGRQSHDRRRWPARSSSGRRWRSTTRCT